MGLVGGLRRARHLDGWGDRLGFQRTSPLALLIAATVIPGDSRPATARAGDGRLSAAKYPHPGVRPSPLVAIRQARRPRLRRRHHGPGFSVASSSRGNGLLKRPPSVTVNRSANQLAIQPVRQSPRPLAHPPQLQRLVGSIDRSIVFVVEEGERWVWIQSSPCTSAIAMAKARVPALARRLALVAGRQRPSDGSTCRDICAG